MTLPLIALLELPSIAAGAVVAAIAIPILIHLLFRQRFQVVRWAAMRFLTAARKKQQRRIDRWFLLLLRILMALLPLLAMIAAMPWAESVWQRIVPGAPETVINAPRTHHILLVDLTLSMSANDRVGRRWEQAIEKANSIIRNARPGDGFSLLALGSNGVMPIIPGPSNDVEKLERELTNLRPTHGTGDFTTALTAVTDILARSPRSYPRRQVSLLTDLQASGWNGLLPTAEVPLAEVWTKLTNRAEVVIVDCGRDTENTAITNVMLADPLPLINESATILATVQHFGRVPRTQLRLELLIARPPETGSEPSFVPVGQQVLANLNPNEPAMIPFVLEGTARFRQPGTHAVRVRLLDNDDLLEDDVRTIAVDVRESVPCLLVNGQPSAEPLKRASEMLADAIAPGGKIRPGHPGRPRVVSLEEFNDATLTDLSGYDCVFLCDVPTFTPSQIARLDAVLKRGGGVVLGMGPNVAANLEHYNRLLYADGAGLLPGKLKGVVEAAIPKTSDAVDPTFRLFGDETTFRLPPLASEFQDANSRAGLTSVPFTKYISMEFANANSSSSAAARRIFSFTSPTKSKAAPEPAIVEFPRHRGRVIAYTSTWNRQWNDWPILPTYPVFVGELLRYAAASPERRTLRVGERFEESFAPSAVGLGATLIDPMGGSDVQSIVTSAEGGTATFTELRTTGLYRVQLDGRYHGMIAVIIPDHRESDLRRLLPESLKAIHPAIQVVSDPKLVELRNDDGPTAVTKPRPHGPSLARGLTILALVVAVWELWLAWRVGPARSAINTGEQAASAGWLAPLVAVPVLLLASVVLGAIVHANVTGEALGFAPSHIRERFETLLGVPSASAGEGTRWRLEGSLTFANSLDRDSIIRHILMGVAALAVVGLYTRERRATGSLRPLVLPALLRLAAYGLLIYLVLPQVRLVFEREGWPDIAIVIDTSASMAAVDEPSDPAVRDKLAELASVEGLNKPQRLRLAKWLLTRANGDWLTRLMRERQLKVQLFALDEQPRSVAAFEDASEVAAAADTIRGLQATGESSRLGDGVQAILRSFRGGSLTAMILMSDGITTIGDDLTRAGREAARAGVPLYIVGLGDAKATLDLSVGDLRNEEAIPKNDELIFEGRVFANGSNLPTSVPVRLFETVDGRLEKRAETTVKPDESGKPIAFRLKHSPTETGQKTFVVEVAVQPNETETANNRIERTVTVTEIKRLKVLLIEGYPRYEFRFLKVLLEREVEPGQASKSVDVSTLLLDASPDHATTDRTALRGFPTRNELLEFDVVVLGDVALRQIDRPAERLRDITDFVKQKGGGLILVPGAINGPHVFADTPLAELLPITRTQEPTKLNLEATAPPYRPRFTPIGLSHPIFRLAADDSENLNVWSKLHPLHWYADGYSKKQTAEVLAVHPERPSDADPSENHPLVLQQFVGNGRVLFVGFDETWRWRFRRDEERFNQFWRQTIRVVSRNRVSKVEIKTDRSTSYRRDEPIKLTVRFPDDSAPPTDGVKVRMDRTPLKTIDGVVGDSETQTLALTKVDGTRATYQGTITRTPVGEYLFRVVSVEQPGGPPRAETKVLPPPGERDKLDINKADMLRAANDSHGKYYTIATAEQFFADLPEAARLPLNSPSPPIPLWNHLFTFVLVLLLFGMEWVLRKRVRLL